MSRLHNISGGDAPSEHRKEDVESLFETVFEKSLAEGWDEDDKERKEEQRGGISLITASTSSATKSPPRSAGTTAVAVATTESRHGAPPLPPSVPFWERLSNNRSQDYAEFQKIKEDREIEKCTFRPKTNENSGMGRARWTKVKPAAFKKGAANAKEER